MTTGTIYVYKLNVYSIFLIVYNYAYSLNAPTEAAFPADGFAMEITTVEIGAMKLRKLVHALMRSPDALDPQEVKLEPQELVSHQNMSVTLKESGIALMVNLDLYFERNLSCRFQFLSKNHCYFNF